MSITRSLYAGLIGVTLLSGEMKAQNIRLPSNIGKPAIVAEQVLSYSAAACLSAIVERRSCKDALLPGALAGGLTSIAKSAVGIDPRLAIPARLVNEAGNSVMEHARYGEISLDGYGFQMYGLHISVGRTESPRVQLVPETMYNAARAFMKGDRLRVARSLWYGTLVFETDHMPEVIAGEANAGIIWLPSRSFPPVVVVRDAHDSCVQDYQERALPKTIGHELDHTLQYRNPLLRGELSPRLVLNEAIDYAYSHVPARLTERLEQKMEPLRNIRSYIYTGRTGDMLLGNLVNPRVPMHLRPEEIEAYNFSPLPSFSCR